MPWGREGVGDCLGDVFDNAKSRPYKWSAFKHVQLSGKNNYSASAFLRVLMHLAQT